MSGDPLFTAVLLAAAGTVAGVLMAAPVGAVNVICIQRTLERGFWAGFAAGLGAVIADGVIGSVAAVSMAVVESVTAAHDLKIKFIGSAVMIAFGLKLVLMEPKVMATATTSMARLRRMVELLPEFLRPALRLKIWRLAPHASAIPQTFFLTITNLPAIAGVLWVFTWLQKVIAGANQDSVTKLVLVTALMAGGTIWWIILANIISRVRHKLSHKRLRVINQVAGGILLVAGAVFFVQFSSDMIRHYRAPETSVRGLHGAGSKPFHLNAVMGHEK